MSNESPTHKPTSSAHDDDPTRLDWLHNGFDEEAMKRGYERAFERAVNATSRPKHWRPVDVDRVG
jgi:hypothetical protein